MSSSQRPAILGGEPVRPQGFSTWPILDDGVRAAFEQLMHSGDWGKYHAEHSQKLIDQLKESYKATHVILTCSGTAAIEIALRVLQVSEGDEVIMSAYDYKPNFMNVRHLKALPVLVDVRADNAQLNTELLEDAITDNTKAILASHLHGAMVDVINAQIRCGKTIPIIEDACQMPGAESHGRAAGLQGDVGIISFGGTKTLSAGRGGAIITNDTKFAQMCNYHTDRGNKVFPLSEMQAAVLLPQLHAFDEYKQQRSACVEKIRKLVASRPYLTPFPAVVNTSPDYYKLGLWYDPNHLSGVSREQFINVMRAEGIPFGPGFRALHLIHSRKRMRISGELPVAELADQSIVGLHHPFLLEPNAVEELSHALDKLEVHATMVQEQVSTNSQPPLFSPG